MSPYSRSLTLVALLITGYGCGAGTISIPKDLEGVRSTFERAEALSSQGQHDIAARILHELASERHSSFLWNRLAVESIHAGLITQAEKAFLEAALWAAPEDHLHSFELLLPPSVMPEREWQPHQYWLARASHRIRSGETKEALEDLSIVVRLVPEGIVESADLCERLRETELKSQAGEVCLFVFRLLNEAREATPSKKLLRKQMFTSTMVIGRRSLRISRLRRCSCS